MTLNEIKKMVISAYDYIADGYLDAYAENDEQDAKHLDVFADKLVGKRILDMGCGIGVNAAHLTKRGFDVLGIDASSNMLKMGHKFFPDLRFEQQDILHTSFDNGSFDGIVLSYVINHFNPEGLTMLRTEIDRLLATNGLIFISAHVGDSEQVLPDPLDDSIRIYYNFLDVGLLDGLFKGYKREYFETRASFGEEEFLCDKMFVVYRK